jgi:putative DNA primase/helicase
MGDQYGENTIDFVLEVDGSPEADLANGRRLVAMFGERLRYIVPWSKWLCWDGTRWTVDDTGQAVRYAKQVADTLPKTVGKGDQPSRTQTAAGINAMLAMAATEPEIALAPAALDADPFLLNVGNGTLDLRTGQLQHHDPSDLLTKIAGAAYDPDAAAPQFAAFLERIQPHPAMRDFLARLFGHTLLGKVVEHVLPILYGVGANGKTTLIEAVTATFGDYARPADPGLLIDRGDVHPTGTAALFGLRLAITPETDAGRRLAEGTVKRLTGGDKITARRMREDFWDFTPSHSIVMVTNHKPIVTGTDEGIWRRLRCVPFDVVIPEDERDGRLPERLALEVDGILAWLVTGYRQWQDRGLAEPEQVTAATSAFRGESDMLGLFIAEKCVESPLAQVQSARLFDAWVDWCKRENLDAGTQTAFSRELTDCGYDKQRTAGHKVWHGIGLKVTEEDE